MKYNVKLVENGIENDIVLEINERQFTLFGEKSDICIRLNDIILYEHKFNILKLVLSSEKLIILEGEQVGEVVKFLKEYSQYNDTDIMLNKLNLNESQKNPLKVCMIYTIIFIIVYDGLVGISVADKMDVGFFAAFMGSVLGGLDDLYPWDFIQKMSMILMFVEIILSAIYSSNLKKKYVNILLANQHSSILVNQNNSVSSKDVLGNIDKYDELERLKELLDKNVITQDDFDEKKKEILNDK